VKSGYVNRGGIEVVFKCKERVRRRSLCCRGCRSLRVIMTMKRRTILATVFALAASLAHGGEKDTSQAAADVYTAAANAVRYALALPRPETSPASVAVEDLIACAELTHYDFALVGPIVGELNAIPPGTDQKPVLESKLTQFEAKAKATAKKPVNFCIDVTI
jgi:hypothetical protein